jgi:hypothetical protein
MTSCDILVSGTGGFAARILFDIAATAVNPVKVVIAGRNRDRLQWLKTAANARAAIFGCPAVFETYEIDLLGEGAATTLIEATRPAVTVQAASIQTSQVIAHTGNAWTRLVAEGGLSATAVFQALISSRVAHAITTLKHRTALINCCFPDVVNGMITARGHQVACGMGNVAILSNVFAGSRLVPGSLKVLAHYQNLSAWRRPAAERAGPAPRVWVDGNELEGVFAAFAAVKLTPEPVIDISGASGVPMLLAMAAGATWSGHVPGPAGLPGGYPVELTTAGLELALPAGLSRDEAIAWNAAFETRSGLVVEAGRVRYTGVLQQRLGDDAPALAEGFAMADLEAVCREMLELRTRLSAQA